MENSWPHLNLESNQGFTFLLLMVLFDLKLFAAASSLFTYSQFV